MRLRPCIPLALRHSIPLTVLALFCVGPGWAAGFGWSDRLDPRLTAVAGSEPIAVWVEFADKGETGPADLAERLAAAERALTSESRHRRMKAHVTPLVDWLDLPLEPRYVQALTDAGFAVYGQSRWFNRVAVHAPPARLVALASLSFVRHVLPVELAEPRARPGLPGTPSAPVPEARAERASTPSAAQVLYGRTLGQIQRLHATALHDSGYIGTAINVCLLDDGFNWYRKHEALKTISISPRRVRDFIRGGSDVQDTVDTPFYFEHGSITLSVLAGRKPGVYLGPAYGCNVVLGRTEDSGSEKPIEMVYWAMGAEWADSLGCDIISSSLGYNVFADSAGTNITYPMLDGHTTIITRAAEIAAAKGILVVTSAGNDGSNRRVGYKISAPSDANGDSVLAIGAVDSLGVRVFFSSKGPTADGRVKPDLAAQGLDVVTMDPLTGDPNTYTRETGTSVSAPLVAGLAACLMQARPTWPPVLIVQALKRTASQAAHPDTLLGWGIPDGLAALGFVPDTPRAPGAGPFALRFTGPNPLRSGGLAATVSLSLDASAPASAYRIRVHDAAGRIVRELSAGTLAPGGSFSFTWRGEDAHGRTLVPGLYFLGLEGARRGDVVRVVVLR